MYINMYFTHTHAHTYTPGCMCAYLQVEVFTNLRREEFHYHCMGAEQY